MAVKKFEVMESKLLNKEIASIAKVGAKLNIRIQIAALNACWYSIQHGDIGFGQRLVLAMNNGLRKNSLVAFLEKFGKFAWDKEQKNLVYKKREDLTEESIANIKEQWYETIKAPEPKSMYDFDSDAAKFIKRMEKAIQDQATIKNVELYDYIAEAFAKFHADQTAQLEQEDTTDNEELVWTEHDQIELEYLMGAEREGLRMAA